MLCKNCGHIVEEKFCGQCGQDSKVARITFGAIAQEISESLLQVNRGFFYTLKELFVRPGKSIREFLYGKRKNHFKPITYVLTLSTLYFLITQLTDQQTWVDEFISGFRTGVSEKKTGVEMLDIVTWFSKNYAYATMLLLPVFSLASYLSFFKLGSNYLEHLVLNAYVTGQQAIFYTLFACLGKFITSETLEFVPFAFSVLYNYWVFWQFFSEGNRWGNLGRSTATYLLYLLFNLMFFVLLTFVLRW